MPKKLIDSNGDIVIDPHKHKERYLKWNKRIEGITKENEDLIVSYIRDMELGRNVSGNKGERSFARLITLRIRMKKIATLFTKDYNKNLPELNDLDASELFKKMRDGIIVKDTGQPYKSVGDYVRVFKAFWHWYQKVRKREGDKIEDITEDLSARNEKPKFAYFTIEELKRLSDHAKYKYKVLMWFLFDSGIRAPTELMNVRVKDITELEDNKSLQLNIREESSKTFGRKIKLLLCNQLLTDYIKEYDLKPDDFLFPINNTVVNNYLKRLGENIIGQKGLTMYDFRHSSACYWLPRYKSESGLKYRFGWKKNEMIYYYTELLGMKDTLQEDDIYIDITKTQLEKELEQQQNKSLLLQEQFNELQEQRKKDMELIVGLIKSVQFTKDKFVNNSELFEKIHESLNQTT